MFLDRHRSEFIHEEQHLIFSQRSQGPQEGFYLGSVVWIGACKNLPSPPHRISGLAEMTCGGLGRDRHPELFEESFSQTFSGPVRPIDAVSARLVVKNLKYLFPSHQSLGAIGELASSSIVEPSLAKSPV